ncbi:uncharacterized protein LOC142321134 [Lycorma delicatula]|uniref:uncharacterized protein LOC142321134 n=1 Tax=Lycorma delicatula TaxID=130591 RepID=UPI003F515655
MLAARITREVEEGEGISPNQFGFWRERTTVLAANKVINWALEVKSGTWRTRRIPLLVSLDVRNAFGTVKWSQIHRALQAKNISPYLRRQVAKYLSERTCTVNSQEGE